MKNLFSIVLCMILVFIGCSAPTHDERVERSEPIWEVKFESGVFPDKDWDNVFGTFTYDAVPNQDSAIEIASTIFKQMKAETHYFDDMSLYSVFFDTEDEIWIVMFSPFEKGELIPGSDCSIAIRKKNAEVLKIWSGE